MAKTKIPLSERLSLSIAEAGELLGIGRSTAFDFADRGIIPTVRIGAVRRVPRRELERLLEVGVVDAEARVKAGRTVLGALRGQPEG